MGSGLFEGIRIPFQFFKKTLEPFDENCVQRVCHLPKRRPEHGRWGTEMEYSTFPIQPTWP